MYVADVAMWPHMSPPADLPKLAPPLGDGVRLPVDLREWTGRRMREHLRHDSHGHASSNDRELTATMARQATAPVVRKAVVLVCHPGSMSLGELRELKESQFSIPACGVE